MRTSARLGLAALIATIMLSVAVTTALAGRLAVSEPSFRVTWASLEFASAATVRCRLRLEGTFHSGVIAKVARSLIGTINGATVIRPCTNGEAWVDNGTEIEPLGAAPRRTPFHITYEGFTSSLPIIGSILFLLSRVSFVVEATVLGFNCRGRYGRAEDNISLTARLGLESYLMSITPVAGRNRLSLVEQLGRNAVCGATVALNGTSEIVTGVRNPDIIRVVLI